MKILIKNGFVVDPKSGIYSKLNLVIEDEKIVDVTLDEFDCEKVINAEGYYVTPGFIDIHMHEEEYDAKNDRIEKSISKSMLQMGATTIFGGNCGMNTMEPKKYLDYVDRDGAPTNVGMFAGHGFFRQEIGVMDKYNPISNEKLKELQNRIKENLDAGCFGVSFGIRYIPGLDEREMLASALHCRKSKKLISAHVRDDADQIFCAIQELINIGLKLDIPIQVSHIGSMGGFGQMKEVLRLIDNLKGNNIDISADCYPYNAFSTRIGETTYDEGFLERYRTDYSCIELCDGKYKGERCNEAIFFEMRRDCPEILTVCHVMKDEDIEIALMHPSVMISSDGLMHNNQGHPRAAGTFPKYLKDYVKTGKVSLCEAVKKISAMPAEKLGLKEKGRLNKGCDADIVILDLNSLKDNATFHEPTKAPEGFKYVIVNGQIAVKDDKILRDDLGKSVRKY